MIGGIYICLSQLLVEPLRRQLSQAPVYKDKNNMALVIVSGFEACALDEFQGIVVTGRPYSVSFFFMYLL